MKAFISLTLILLSFLLSFLKVAELKTDKDKAELLFKLSEKLKENLHGEMHSVFKACEDFFNNNYTEGLSLPSTDALIAYINEEFSGLPYISEYSELLSSFSHLPSDELLKQSERLVGVAEKGYLECAEKYKRDKKSVYIAFPGITAVFILILL